RASARQRACPATVPSAHGQGPALPARRGAAGCGFCPGIHQCPGRVRASHVDPRKEDERIEQMDPAAEKMAELVQDDSRADMARLAELARDVLKRCQARGASQAEVGVDEE